MSLIGKLMNKAKIDTSGGVSSTQILVGSSGGIATPRTMSGDATLSNTGVLTIGSDKIGNSELEDTHIQYATVTLTNAEIKALAATQKTLVAAPGAGLVLEFISAILKLTAGTEVLSEAADNLAIRYTDGSGVIVSEAIENTGFIDQAADTYTNAIAKKDNIVAATGAENKALVLDNTGDAEIGGNASADATMTVKIAYRVHDFS